MTKGDQRKNTLLSHIRLSQREERDQCKKGLFRKKSDNNIHTFHFSLAFDEESTILIEKNFVLIIGNFIYSDVHE